MQTFGMWTFEMWANSIEEKGGRAIKKVESGTTTCKSQKGIEFHEKHLNVNENINLLAKSEIHEKIQAPCHNN